MHFPDRVYGLEHEYGFIDLLPSGSFQQSSCTNIEFMTEAIPGSVLSRIGRLRMWHPNGSCSYVDTGNHPEHATAECRSVRDAVCHAKAGDLLINQIFSRPHFWPFKLHLFKNNIGYHDKMNLYTSFGCHENYMAKEPASFLSTLGPLLITRQIIDGAGWWCEAKTSSCAYHLSQRALMMEYAVNSSTVQGRGIWNNKTTNDSGKAPRIHIICGDSNILEFAAYLKIGAVALILALIEANKSPCIPILDPVRTMQIISSSADPFRACVGETSGESKSAFDIQTIYLEAARKELAAGSFDSEDTEAELKHIALCWEQALNAIYNRDIKWMLGRLDHVTKKYLTDREVARRRLTDPDEIFSLRKDMDIMYHNIMNMSLQERMNRTWADRRILTDQEVEQACAKPPKTRASIRSRFIAYAIEHDIYPLHIDWAYVGFRASYDDCFAIQDPLAHESADLDPFLSLWKDRGYVLVDTPDVTSPNGC